MQAAYRQYLKFVDYSSVINWSTRYLIGSDTGYNKSYSFKSLLSILEKNRDVLNIQDDVKYKRVTVRIKGAGVCLRDEELGQNIGTKRQFLVKPGQFIISKIDARNGAMGVVPNGLDGAIVTNDFPLFDINTNIVNPEYLRLITTTEAFIKIAHGTSSGTTNRQRVDIENLLKHEIPLPSIDEQGQLIADYNKKMQEADKLSLEGDNLEKEERELFFDEIGYSWEKIKAHSSSLKFVDFRNLERWNGKPSSTITANYSVEVLKTFILEISTGTTPPTSIREYFDGEINFYTPADLGSSMYLNNAERKISELAIIERKARVFKKDTLLFVGIGSTVGKVGVVMDNIASSNQQITGLNFNDKYIDVRYAYHYFNFMKHITTKEQTKSTIPIVNQEKILNIPIVVPPLDKQSEIVAKLDDIQLRVNRIKELVIVLRKQAQQEFEQAIFGKV